MMKATITKATRSALPRLASASRVSGVTSRRCFSTAPSDEDEGGHYSLRLSDEQQMFKVRVSGNSGEEGRNSEQGRDSGLA
jgi:hypothetical protein